MFLILIFYIDKKFNDKDELQRNFCCLDLTKQKYVTACTLHNSIIIAIHCVFIKQINAKNAFKDASFPSAVSLRFYLRYNGKLLSLTHNV